MAETAPKSEEPIVQVPESASTVAKIEEVEKELAHLKKTISFVSDTNKFILVVLLVAVLALIFAAVYGFKQSVDSNNNSQLEIRKSLQELQIKYDNLKR